MPSASIDQLRSRAAILAKIRDFFTQRNYLEVETPIMAKSGITDVYLSNIKAQFNDKTYYLQTSPEYHMKRLLAAGSGNIFQFARVFRDDEFGRWDHHELMQEVDVLLQLVLGCKPLLKKTYQQAFIEICQLDPLDTTVSEIKTVLARYDLHDVLSHEDDLDQHLFLLMSHVIEPALAELSQPVAIYHFPRSQAALAQVHDGVAERFEVYFQGVELANGFHELTDPNIQHQRFKQDQAARVARGLDIPPADEYLLQALQHGLPACSGVALGIDRLLALASNQSSIAETMAFNFSRA